MVGLFTVDVEIARPGDRPVFTAARGLLVDTGSDATWVSADVLARAGVRVRFRDQAFVMANGAAVTRDVGYAIIRCGEFETIDEVVFARQGDLQLLGARTLEGFNARVDPRNKRLVAGGPRPAAAMAQKAGSALRPCNSSVRDAGPPGVGRGMTHVQQLQEGVSALGEQGL